MDRDLLVSFSNVETSTVLFRRSVVEEVGGIDVSLPSEQNHDLFYRMSKVAPFDFVPESLVVKTAPGTRSPGGP